MGNSISIEELQRAFCKERATEYAPVNSELKCGLARGAKNIPVNGLRHPAEEDSTGWYIWFGEEFSDAPDFFVPVHVRHVYEEYPEIAKLLGLPPGYRFLIANNYLDIWYDASLLNV